MFNFFCKILQHPKINPGSAPDCNFPSLILLSMIVITLYSCSNRFFQKPNGLTDGRVVPMTKNEHSFAVLFLCIALRSL